MEIEFGAFAEKLNVQLREQGIPNESLESFDKINDAIERLRMNGYFTEKQVDRLRRELIRRIEQRAHVDKIVNPNMTRKIK